MNIEKLAREAGPLIKTPFDKWCKQFAALVLEEAAKEADKRRHAGDAGPAAIADAIRALKDKT